MATGEQTNAGHLVMDTVTALNNALGNASAAGLFVELRHLSDIGRNGHYQVEIIETRETVLPCWSRQAGSNRRQTRLMRRPLYR